MKVLLDFYYTFYRRASSLCKFTHNASQTTFRRSEWSVSQNGELANSHGKSDTYNIL